MRRAAKRPWRKTILLVAFGTSVPEARSSFDIIEAQVRKAFPEVDLQWAFTSKTIRARLEKRGEAVDSPEMALARLMADGTTHVSLLSLHTIPGIEFHDLYRNARLFVHMSGGFECVAVARPLLSSYEDMVRVANALVKAIPSERKPEDAVLFMGHGSKNHPSDAIYTAMNHILQRLDSHVFMGAAAGHPSLDDLLPTLKENKIKRIYLLPFMLVVGEHIRNDMVGDRPDSWKSILTENGFICESILKGTADYPEIVDVWLDHLREAVFEMESTKEKSPFDIPGGGS